MFSTPPKHVMELRKTAQRCAREQVNHENTKNNCQGKNSETGGISNRDQADLELRNMPLRKTTGGTKSEIVRRRMEPSVPGSSKGSRKSTEAKRKELQFWAEQEKAKIKMALIDRHLEAKLAALVETDGSRYSPREGTTERSDRSLQGWVDQQCRYQQEQHNMDQLAGELPPAAPAPYTAPGPASGPAADVTVTGLVDTVQMLVAAVKDLSISNNDASRNTSLLSRLSTPKDLPEFYGDPMEWLQFKQAYQESTEVCKFSEKENLWRLRKCLRGPAKDTVNALFISATSPDKIMSTLELQFGNPDRIINRILYDIKRLQPLSQDYQKDIVLFAVKVQNFVEAVRAVGCEEYLQGVTIVSTLLTKLPTVLVSKWSDYSYKLITERKVPRLAILSDFLTDEAKKISTTASIFAGGKYDTMSGKHEHNKHRVPENVNQRPHTILVQSNDLAAKCNFCRRESTQHILPDCKQFKRALRKVRWEFVKRNGLCYRCLISRHARDICAAPVCDKDNCGQEHHRLLHFTTIRPRTENTPENTLQLTQQSLPATTEPSTAETVTHMNVSGHKSLLQVVPVYIHGPKGVIKAKALLDGGSTISMIRAELSERAGLTGRQETMCIRGAWSKNKLVCDANVVNVNLSGIMDSKVYSIRARSVKELDLPMQNLSYINFNDYVHLKFLNNIDYVCNSDVKPDLLIGQDNHYLLRSLQCVEGNAHGTAPLLQGCRKRGRRSTAEVTLFISEYEPDPLGATSEETLLRDIHDEVRRSFKLDAVGIESKPRTNADDARAIAQLECTSELINGRWQVGLPWKDEKCKMPDTYPRALKRLEGIEKKMLKDSGFATRYEERVNHLLDNDFARILKDEEAQTISPRTWYLSHFGVDNPNKKKLRLVFDAADKVNGKSLNDYLLTGPDLLKSLFGIMLRFRENKIAVTGDIKDMFLRVKIRPEDQDALRFLWRSDPTTRTKTYVMTSLLFGANCSPFVAQFIKNKNAKRFESTQPAAVDAIVNSHYMDDYIDSLPDEPTAIEMVRNVTNIHKEGGFEIRNWTSNSVAVLNSVSNEALGTAAVRFKIDQQCEGERILGMIWYPGEDQLAFDVSLKRVPEMVIQGKERPTKRLMLRVVMSIFDVLGFLSPFTIQGRIMLQDTWRLNIGWDDYIPDEVYVKWCKWIDLLQMVKEVRIPRCYHMFTCANVTNPTAPISCVRTPGVSTLLATNSYETVAVSTRAASEPAVPGYDNLQLHMFSDLSAKAMSAVGYWRWVNNEGHVQVALIASKCRVLPTKPMTIPRAELQAALLAARLADTIVKEHKLTPVRRYFWCDSTTVLHWIQNNTRTYKVFVANRLGEIDELTRAEEWRYISTKMNVADLATRESFDRQVFQSEWFTGPLFLYQPEPLWPKDILQREQPSEETLECVTLTQETSMAPSIPEPQRFSSWLRLVRSTAMMLKFIDRCRKLKGDIDCNTMEQAERLLLKHAQAESFPEELAAITKGKPVLPSSKLLTLSPVLDQHGVLRVGGRIDAVQDVSQEIKQPVILDGQHPVSRLIVRHYHVKAAHGNQETVVNELKQRYWITRLRPTVKGVASRCMLCRIRKAKPQVPRMGDLPSARLAHHQPPFSHCGIDLFGPMDVTVGRRHEKRYGVLFTCLTVRAIHIEIVHNLTSDSLIMALQRMAARRGWPHNIFSDNGTNLRGADRELRNSMQELLKTEALQTEGSKMGFKWTFIPPASPHWGGAWERLIRSVKASLQVILKQRAPRDEVLSTLMVEVENIVNSRPLAHVSVEPCSVETLTPNHFLLGRSSNMPVMGSFDHSDLNLRKNWRKVQALSNMFWKRWVREILPDLLPRRKWQEERRPLAVGDLVLVVDPDSPRNTWPKGLITQVFPGKDGRIRMVEVRTGTGTLRRSAARVAPISLEC